MTDGDSYYWASGAKVRLLASDQVVLDLDSSKASPADVDSLRAQGVALTRSLLMVPRTAATQAVTGSAGTVHPVFRTEDGSLVAVLPEVRVEAEPGALDRVARSVTGAHVTERTDERLTLVPDSGSGDDALRLANELTEAGEVEVSQARFMRVVARPGA